MFDVTHILKNYQEYQEIFIIGSRGEGKTYQTVHGILPQIDQQKKSFLGLRRYPDDSRYSLLDYFRQRINEYCERQGLTQAKQERIGETIVRGVFYRKKNHIVFSELEHYSKARGAFSENPNLIIFDEALPTLLDGKSDYLRNEPDKFRDFGKSAWRNKSKSKPSILHLANPYDRTFHRLVDGDEEIEEIANKSLWTDDKIKDDKVISIEGKPIGYGEKDKQIICPDTNKIVKKKLVFFRVKGDEEGGPKFFIKKGDLNVKEISAKHLLPLEIYNSKYLLSRTRTGSILYLTNLEYVEETKKKKLVDYHFSEKTFFLTPASRGKELLSPKLSALTKSEWNDLINNKLLFFSSFSLRQEIIELLVKDN